MKKISQRIWGSALAILATAELSGSALASPDPSIALALTQSTPGFDQNVQAGGHITWYIKVGNAGDQTAQGIVARAAIPAGLSFVVGSLVNVDTTTTTIEYSNDEGASWSYRPVGTPGAADPKVTDIRLTRNGLGANPDGQFIAITAEDFAQGSHDHTWYDADQGVRIDMTRASGGATATGTYTTRVFPFESETPITSWKKLHVAQTTVAGEADIAYDVLDATSGQVIEGFSGLSVGAGNDIDLTGLSAVLHPRLKIRASLSAHSSGACMSIIADQTDPGATCTPDPLGVNNNNVVFGNLWRSGQGCKQRGFRWTSADRMTVLQGLHGDDFVAYVYAMNDNGVAVGESLTENGHITHAVAWASNATTATDLQGATFGANVSSWATAINASGVVAGTLGGAMHGPFRWNGTMQTPSSLPENAEWDWRALINATGDVAGRYKPFDSATWHAYLWRANGDFIDIAAPGDVRFVTGINASGWVTGYGKIAKDGWVFRPDQGANGTVIELAKAQGAQGTAFVATAISNGGKVVGSYVAADGHRRPFEWTVSGGVADLGTNNWASGEALAMNDNGAVLVAAYDTGRATAPYSRLGISQGGPSLSMLAVLGPLDEQWLTREVMEGYHPFNNDGKVTGFYVPAGQFVGDEPAEIPYFSGECGSGAPSLASIGVTYEGPGGITASFDTLFDASACSGEHVARATVTSTTSDANLGNNIGSGPLFLSKPDLGVTVTSDSGVAAQGAVVTWTVVLTNYGLAPVRSAAADLELTTLGGTNFQTLWGDGEGGVVHHLLKGITLAPGESRSATFTDEVITPDPDVQIIATATTNAALDCASDNNTASTAVVTGSYPNLYVVSAATPIVNTGGTLTYVVTFGNNGNGPFLGQAVLAAGVGSAPTPASAGGLVAGEVGGMVLTSAAITSGPTSGFDFVPGGTVATYSVDGTVNPVYPGSYWTMQLTVKAPPCVLTTAGLVSSNSLWNGTTPNLDGNPTDNASNAQSLVAGQPTDNPDLCTAGCASDAECAIKDPVCAGTGVCFPTLGGCVYNEVALNSDVDGTFCTVNERCVNGALVTDVRDCNQTCTEATGATCDKAKDACVDLYPPGSTDADHDGVPAICDSCDTDFYNCSAPLTAIYAVVQDAQGKPAGTIKCSRNADTGDLTCETKVDPNTGLPTDELVIHPDLVCAP